MFFAQLVDRDLGCASYVLGDAGRAVVVDPTLDADRALAAAAQHGATIDTILETHVHADHVSGRAILAAITGARVLLPAGGGQAPDAGDPIAAGDTLTVGALRITALGAPGHRPEHLAFAVTDTARSPEPWLLLTGDSLLVGDLARPDLAVDPRTGAGDLHDTLARLLALGPEVEVWPGHVGGSLCGGRHLSSKTSSTLGFEARANPLLAETDGDRFARRLIAGVVERPPTVARVVARNRRADPVPIAPLAPVDATAIEHLLARGVAVVDGRPLAAFDTAHHAGALSLPVGGRGVGTRAAWVLDPAAEAIAWGPDEPGAREVARRLRAVGFDAIAGIGWGTPSGPGVVRRAAIPVDALDPEALTVVDVRDDDERRAGAIPGSLHVPVSRLAARTPELPAGPLAVICAAGGRAAFAASWLRRAGHDATRVAGGVGDVLARAADRAAAVP